PRQLLGHRLLRRERPPAEIVVGDPRDPELRSGRDPGPDRRAGVHLDHLQEPVAVVTDELDVREAAVADRTQEPLAELVHVVVVARGEDRARAEAQRALADLPADDAGERLAVAPDVREER